LQGYLAEAGVKNRFFPLQTASSSPPLPRKQKRAPENGARSEGIA